MSDWDFSLNTSDDWSTAADSWGPTFDSSSYDTSSFDTPSYDFSSADGGYDWSTVFSNSDWMADSGLGGDFDISSVFDNADWFSNPDSLGPEYDPLTDPDASTADILSYFDKYIDNPDLYSLGSDGGFGGDDSSLLGIGSNLLSLSGDNNLGQLLTSALQTDGLSSSTSVASKGGSSGTKSLLDALNKLLGGANSAARSPLGQLAQKLMAIASKRKDITNQNKGYERAQATAMANSQRDMRGNRTGLPNFNGAAQDPYSYVQAAPTIERTR